MARPSLYRPIYCETVAKFHTIAAFYRHIGVNSATVYLWIGAHPEFAEAVKAMTRQHPGRLYRAAYCEQVIDFLKDGHSVAAFAGHIGVSSNAIYRWMDKYPEFAEAVKCAQAKSVLWWERRVIELAQGGQGNANAIMFGLRNRASGEWRENNHTEITGKVEQVHRIERVLVRPEHSDR